MTIWHFYQLKWCHRTRLSAQFGIYGSLPKDQNLPCISHPEFLQTTEPTCTSAARIVAFQQQKILCSGASQSQELVKIATMA